MADEKLVLRCSLKFIPSDAVDVDPPCYKLLDALREIGRGHGPLAEIAEHAVGTFAEDEQRVQSRGFWSKEEREVP